MDIQPGAAPPGATTEIIAWVAHRLRARGERMSRSRVAVLTALGEHPGHLTADELYRAVAAIDPSIHLSSVYRALTVLLSLGAVQHLHLHGATAYSLVRGPHLHAQCARCGAVLELPADLLDDVAARVAAELQFTLDATHVALSGHCAACSAEGAGHGAVAKGLH